MLLDFLDLFFSLSLLHKDQLILAVSGILSFKKFKTSKKLRKFLCLLTLILLDFLDLFFSLSLLHKDQLILAVSGILSFKKFKTSKKLRNFLCLLTLIMKYEPYLGEKSFLIYGIIS